MEIVMEPFKYFHGKPWWEVADMSDFENETAATKEEKEIAGNS
jgi:hypothetical protein